MNILIFNWRDIKNHEAGGAEVFTHENATRWVKKGNEVTLFASEFNGCGKEEVIDGVRIIRAGGKYIVYRKAREYYNNYFSEEGFDIVIDEINTRPFLTPEFVNKGEKIIALIHQLAREYWQYETPFPLNVIGYYFLEKSWLRNYVDIPTVTVSESTKKDLHDLGFKNVEVVPEGLNFKPVDRVKEKEETPVIIYVGRLKRAKRADHAIKAFEMVKEVMPDAKLWIVGDGYLRNDLEKSACDGVKFFGYVPEEEKKKLLSRAWALVNPSVREGWGINVIEANAYGTPCIAYDVPGLRDSISDGETGILVGENGSVDKLAETMTSVLEDEELRVTLSKNVLMYAKRFSWDKSADEFLKAMER